MFLTYLSARLIERVTKLLTKHFFLTLQTADFSLCAWKKKMVAWSTVAVWVLHKRTESNRQKQLQYGNSC